MDKDIVPELLRNIQNDFDKEKENSELVQQLLKILEEGQANYLNANAYAVEIGELLSKVLNKNVTAERLPDGKMYFNIADRILNNTLHNNYKLITDYSMEVQSKLNKKANLHIKAIQPPINQDRINGIVNRISSEDSINDIKWILGEPIINFSQSIVDDSIKINTEFHYKIGLSPEIKRVAVGKACKWCKELEGKYSYPENVPKDVYHRHENCRCTVDYNPKDGKGKQNVWNKSWRKMPNTPKNGIIEKKEKTLTNKNRAAILKYISSESYVLNDLMRNHIELPPEFQQLHDDLLDALDKLPRYSGEINRSLYFEDDIELEKFFEAHTVEKIIRYNHFLSFSTGIYDERDSIRLKVPNSKNSVDLRNFNPNEKETLYKPSQKFIVKDKYFEEGKPIIVLEELE
ncbi:hypothetical protein [Enterococcus cecorum]|uniref:hypothetical protein n=1 Tax=Enterococcus cecorum TaxID=44008 RepID=UPI001FAD530C|nr:hypothetical protein [Enterococcus cecorum]MCJ0600299.1 hypothetical protein [Enterococcus cecorum]